MGVKKIDRKKFQSEASKNNQPKVSESLVTGETGWLVGQAIKSEPGTVTIKTPENFFISISENDVLEYGHVGDSFCLQVKTGADVHTRFESVNKLYPARRKDDCDCHQKEDQYLQRRLGQGPAPSDPVIVIGCTGCWIEYEEMWCKLNGYIIRCYKPVLKCGRVCPDPVIA